MMKRPTARTRILKMWAVPSEMYLKRGKEQQLEHQYMY